MLISRLFGIKIMLEKGERELEFLVDDYVRADKVLNKPWPRD